MTETPSRREQAREERRGQILEAALAVFSDKGYHATNVSDVAAKAGVSQGTIYWYFDSKDELFKAAILAVFEQFGADTMIGMLDHETATEKLRGLTSAMDGLNQTVPSSKPGSLPRKRARLPGPMLQSDIGITSTGNAPRASE